MGALIISHIPGNDQPPAAILFQPQEGRRMRLPLFLSIVFAAAIAMPFICKARDSYDRIYGEGPNRLYLATGSAG
jgi:hypothetical protein